MIEEHQDSLELAELKKQLSSAELNKSFAEGIEDVKYIKVHDTEIKGLTIKIRKHMIDEALSDLEEDKTSQVDDI